MALVLLSATSLGFQFKVSTIEGWPSMTWQDAKQKCIDEGNEKYGSPMEIASLWSKADYDYLKGIAQSNGVPVWIGSNDIANEGEWAWADGVTFVDRGFVPEWGGNQPDNHQAVATDDPTDPERKGEHCARFETGGYLNDMRCSNPSAFACEHDRGTPMPPFPPPSPAGPPPVSTPGSLLPEDQAAADSSKTAVAAAVAGGVAAAVAGAVGGAVAGGAGGGASGGGGGAAGMAMPLIFGAQRFTATEGLGVEISPIHHGVAGGMGWASGELGFTGGSRRRRLQAAAPSPATKLTNTLLTCAIAILIVVLMQVLAVLYWKKRANRNYSGGVLGVGASGTFSPFPKFLVWPSPLLFVLQMFMKGLTQQSMACIASGDSAAFGVIMLLLTVGTYIGLVVDLIFFRRRMVKEVGSRHARLSAGPPCSPSLCSLVSPRHLCSSLIRPPSPHLPCRASRSRGSRPRLSRSQRRAPTRSCARARPSRPSSARRRARSSATPSRTARPEASTCRAWPTT